MKDPRDMTIFELKEYVNSLSNEELLKFSNEFEPENEDIDVIALLNAARLYDFMQFKEKGNLDIEI